MIPREAKARGIYERAFVKREHALASLQFCILNSEFCISASFRQSRALFPAFVSFASFVVNTPPMSAQLDSLRIAQTRTPDPRTRVPSPNVRIMNMRKRGVRILAHLAHLEAGQLPYSQSSNDLRAGAQDAQPARSFAHLEHADHLPPRSAPEAPAAEPRAQDLVITHIFAGGGWGYCGDGLEVVRPTDGPRGDGSWACVSRRTP